MTGLTSQEWREKSKKEKELAKAAKSMVDSLLRQHGYEARIVLYPIKAGEE